MLLGSLDLLQDSSPLRTDEKLEIREKAHENIRKAFAQYVTTYNLCSRPLAYHVGQPVFKRNFAQSRQSRSCS